MNISGRRFRAAAFCTMKQKNSFEKNDQPLSELLGQWKFDAPLPPRFRESVWRRIAQAEAKASRWQSFTSWIEAMFKRPALATSYVAVLFFVGLTTGYWQAHDKTAHEQSQGRTLYVQSVDPYQVPRH
jgi:hypothetical protein